MWYSSDLDDEGELLVIDVLVDDDGVAILTICLKDVSDAIHILGTSSRMSPVGLGNGLHEDG